MNAPKKNLNVLILGGGGREHAMAYKAAQSPQLGQLFVAPGNAGTAQLATNLALNPEDPAAVEAAVRQHGINLVIVGPEAPLVAGLADHLGRQFPDGSVGVVGPVAAGARLEGSKDFAKAFMAKYGIPTAQYRSFQAHQLDEALAYVANHPLPIVVKADGLAAGKGVVIAHDVATAQAALQGMLSGHDFGAAGQTVVVEQFLPGIEISVFIATDGQSYTLLPMAKDYKRQLDGDQGPITGGMGAVSPVPFATRDLRTRIREQVIRPTLAGLRAEGIDYKGFIFFGLMVVDEQPYLLEYNCRMGDPETEVVLPRIETDFLELMQRIAHGGVRDLELSLRAETCATVICASGGYPGPITKGYPITGLDATHDTPHSLVFHAGTALKDNQVVTAGGRVLAVSAFGKDVVEATTRAAQRAEAVQFEGRFFRRDIGLDLLRFQPEAE